ncbi:hypothetical protein DC345_24080 [Paenibacillus taichungensis]|uniref:Uncharacterized protein n=1 Tax=Paenibacillus taichungensis TaxID=484184 RepID=A0A329QJV2_9BACL|nr:hypothetical protein DC345_24080 [Paenibacillus taichungensis]
MDLKFEESADAGSFLIRLESLNVKALIILVMRVKIQLIRFQNVSKGRLHRLGLFCIFGNSGHLH